ncbi:CWF19-like protein 1 [Physella acuta]|uniref:CWF19-like protein 1 n=1 Tax=Physella acuta TaxID=109671 RepID=UPI0027DCEFAC|nr:CWF19-like protein 1 [Physella acuta]XP_059168517.1 CWF19-like protein 1 [Physella acuta]XP_059168518.1 CWF19-like protein 1 [Physella acuta]XP_059168519.1 CWF19-like protein 1 [Physella acuta]
MAAKPLKILVAGDVEGNFSQLFKRVQAIQKKSGNFDLLLCVGDFFGSDLSTWEPYKTKQLKVPLSTLILGPTKPELAIYYDDEKGAELCEGVTYLGKQGRFTGSSGLQLAYLSGLESSSDKGDNCTFTAEEAKSLVAPIMADTNFKGIDIFITSQWPKDVEKYGSTLSHHEKKYPASPCISEVARVLRPRYHFAGLEDIFYERQPYRNHHILLDATRHTTRFISLASVANKDKQKYLYAFTIVPLSKLDPAELIKQPEDVTECPYTANNVLNSKQEEKGQQFFYDMNAKPDQKGKRRGNERGGRDGENERRYKNDDEKRPRKTYEPAGACWFCLGSPEVEKHLVVSVGDKAYLALAKGGLVPDHVLILPVHHHQSLVSSPDDVIEQIDKYKACLRKMFKSQGKSCVFFERNFRTQHLQIQAVPFPQDCIVDVKDTFMACAEAEAIELVEIPKHSDLKQILPDGVPYFYVELPSGERCLHRISKQFPLQFGREAVCEPAILNMPERVDWRNCKLEKDEETELAGKFKTDFRPFDFNFS